MERCTLLSLGCGGFQSIYDVRGWSDWPCRNPPMPLWTPPRNPARAKGNFPFFDPLEAEFEKVVFTKNVALAMFYLVVFENSKKVNF